MARVALAIAYDGTRFDSYARQPGHRTVEGELLATLDRAGAFGGGASPRFRSGSRTDAGVSAAWNVVALDTDLPPEAIVAAGTDAPPGLHLLSAVRVDDAFEPRHARRRIYQYALDESWDWAQVGPVAAHFEGDHDFTNFRRADGGKPPRASLTRIRYRPRPPTLEFEAPRFLWHQVRRIVAALDRVRRGKVPAHVIRQALADPSRRVDLGLAPAEPLLLLKVDYAGLRFAPVAPAVRARLARETASAQRRLAWANAIGRRVRAAKTNKS